MTPADMAALGSRLESNVVALLHEEDKKIFGRIVEIWVLKMPQKFWMVKSFYTRDRRLCIGMRSGRQSPLRFRFLR